ncbi:MAG: hypothetical protein IJN54_16545 [Lachnospiraceae bacterium]|nr:hypothetical protein [Lachnospiraceae bacterium]
MADWNDIKNAFERDAKKAEENFFEREQKLLKNITIYLCEQKGVSPLQGYNPDEAIAFLDKPVDEIKNCLGGDWTSISNDQMETLIYSLSKKVKKSEKIISW